MRIDRSKATLLIGEWNHSSAPRDADYPDWKTLLRGIAEALGLEIDDEHDLAAVTQYSINQTTGKHLELSRLIPREFPPKPEAPETFRLLARLPLRNVWTTNCDTLAESA